MSGLSIGIDIGGTKIAAGVITRHGQIRERRHAPTPSDPVAIVDRVSDMIEELREAAPVAAVGVAAAGMVDRTQRFVLHAPNIAWHNEPLAQLLESRIRLPVILENDVNAAGWGEYRFGAGAESNGMMMVALGTGIGGAAMIDGTLLRGAFGAATEIGHLPYVKDGRACGCGQTGCLEQYGSGTALRREANDVADIPGLGQRLSEARAAGGGLAPEAFADLVRDQDPGAQEALRRVGTAVGEGCAMLQSVLDPEVFVIGGGLSALGADLLTSIVTAYRGALPAGGDRPHAQFLVAHLGNDAGIIGAGALATDRSGQTR